MDIFLIFAQNIDRGYEAVLTICVLEQKQKKNRFYYIKVGFKVVYISQTCYPDVKAVSHRTRLDTRFQYGLLGYTRIEWYEY